MNKLATEWGKPLLVISVVALIYTGAGMMPGRLMLPLDLKSDIGAWKADPTVRRPVSNRLLSDVVTEHLPWDREMSRLLGRGQMPWVNVWAGDGAPLFANPETALFSPFTMTRLLFGLRAWAVVLFLKLLLAAAGTMWLMRQLGASVAAATVSSLVLMMSGYSILWAYHPHTNVFAFLPALTAAAVRLSRQPSVFMTAVVIVLAAFATAGGHPETLFVGVVAIAIFLIFVIRANRVRVGAAAFAGFLIGSAQLIVFLTILSTTVAAAERSNAETPPFRAVAIAGQILPGFLGSPLRNEIDLTALLPFGENFNERNSTYFGFVALVVVLSASRRLDRSLRCGLLIALGAAMIGWRVPGLYHVVQLLPGVSLVVAERFAGAVALFGAIAVGPALFVVARSNPARRLGAALGAAGLLLVIGGTLPSLPIARPMLMKTARAGIDVLRERGVLLQPPDIYEERLHRYLLTSRSTALRRAAVPGLFWIVGGVGLAALRARKELLGIAVIGELLAFGVGYLPSIGVDDVPGTPRAVADVKLLDPQRNWMIAAAPEVYPPNLATEEQLRDIRRYDGLGDDVSRRSRLIAAGFDAASNAFPTTITPEQIGQLATLGVRFILSREPLAATVRVGGSEPPGVGVYEIPNAARREYPKNSAPAGIQLAVVTTVAGLLIAAIVMFTRTARTTTTPL